MTQANGSILGTRVQRVEDPALLTAGGSYIGNLDLPGAAHVTYVRSGTAHARLLGVDVDAARRAPGIVAVLTASDLDELPPAPPAVGPPAFGTLEPGMRRPYLAQDVVRFVGEPVAVIISESRSAGADAADLVIVEDEPLPVVVDSEQAARDDLVLFPEAGTNIALSMTVPSNEHRFDDCDVVVHARLRNSRMAVAPIEPRACAAHWDGVRLTQWSCSQGAHGTRARLATALGLDPALLRVIVPDVGGGFGGKHGAYPEEVMVGWLAMKLGRPMRWLETRTEHMQSFCHGRDQVQYATLGGSTDGRLLAYELFVIQDCGAYPSNHGAFLPMMTRTMASGCYAIPDVAYGFTSVVTNTTPVGAFRGAGRPEATAAIERMIDVFANEAGLDPVAVRRTNFIAPESFPYLTSTGASYDSGDYAATLTIALDTIDIESQRAEQRRRIADDDRILLGIGISTYVEITNPLGGGEYGAIEVHDDGTATLLTGSSPHGQGHGTSYRMIASDITGIPMDLIDFRFGDTDTVPRGGGTGGSRSLQVGGSAIHHAAELLVETARQRAADALEASLDDVVHDRSLGVFHVTGTPSVALTWATVSSHSPEPLKAEIDYQPSGSTYPFGAHVAVVEVDRETGRVTVREFVAVDDAGRVLNPLILDGQIHGGLASGIAQALYEEIRYDDDGNPITSNFADYGIITAAELPPFQLRRHETLTPRNPLGAKGIGEAGTIGATPAVQNAVVDSLRHLGVRHLDLPITPERVWRAIYLDERSGVIAGVPGLG